MRSTASSPLATPGASSTRRCEAMIDFVVRNARVAGRHDTLTDIGFENGRIAAVEPNLVCDATAHDAEGCLCCGGLVETHIHLDKSRIIDRCAPETGRVHNAMKRVS